jgi:hypothetical protein
MGALSTSILLRISGKMIGGECGVYGVRMGLVGRIGMATRVSVPADFVTYLYHVFV